MAPTTGRRNKPKSASKKFETGKHALLEFLRDGAAVSPDYALIIAAVQKQHGEDALVSGPLATIDTCRGIITIGDIKQDSLYGLTLQQLLVLVDYEIKHNVNIFFPKRRITDSLKFAPLITVETCPIVAVNGEDHFAMPANGEIVHIPARFIRNPATNRAPDRALWSLSDVKLYRSLMPRLMRRCLPPVVQQQTRALLQHADPLESPCRYPIYQNISRKRRLKCTSLAAFEAIYCAGLGQLPSSTKEIFSDACSFFWSQCHLTFVDQGVIDPHGNPLAIVDVVMRDTRNRSFYANLDIVEEDAFNKFRLEKGTSKRSTDEETGKYPPSKMSRRERSPNPVSEEALLEGDGSICKPPQDAQHHREEYNTNPLEGIERLSSKKTELGMKQDQLQSVTDNSQEVYRHVFSLYESLTGQKVAEGLLGTELHKSQLPGQYAEAVSKHITGWKTQVGIVMGKLKWHAAKMNFDLREAATREQFLVTQNSALKADLDAARARNRSLELEIQSIGDRQLATLDNAETGLQETTEEANDMREVNQNQSAAHIESHVQSQPGTWALLGSWFTS